MIDACITLYFRALTGVRVMSADQFDRYLEARKKERDALAKWQHEESWA